MIQERDLLNTRDGLGQEVESTLLEDDVTWIHLFTTVIDIIALGRWKLSVNNAKHLDIMERIEVHRKNPILERCVAATMNI